MSAPDNKVAAPGLGIDAGGTRTRWALADATGKIIGEGEVGGLSVQQIDGAAGSAHVQRVFQELAVAALALARPARACAGLTGLGEQRAVLVGMLAPLLGLAPEDIDLRSDIEVAYLNTFAPGHGYLVYAGTGSIGAWIDSDGQLHRAGGRGVALDDGGGGYAIARDALRKIWRDEDETPGCWQASPMAHAVFATVGGSDWSHTRQFMATRSRGEVGQLALAVASSAGFDPAAHAILRHAGAELARLALALVARFGVRPVVLAGRAATLHPVIEQTLRAALPAAVSLCLGNTDAHHTAARIAARSGQRPISLRP